jgi:hypothetical protein
VKRRAKKRVTRFYQYFSRPYRLPFWKKSSVSCSKSLYKSSLNSFSKP